MLNRWGRQVVRSNWMSAQLKECRHGNIFDDSPTNTHRLSCKETSCDWKVPQLFYPEAGVSSQPTGQKQWSQAWQMKQTLPLELRPSMSPRFALSSSWCLLLQELVLQNKQERPLPPYIRHSSRYHFIRASFPVKTPKSTLSMYSCRDLSAKLTCGSSSLSPSSLRFQFFQVSSAVFLNLFLQFSSIDPAPMRLSLSMACSMQMGSLLPSPSRENWQFQIDTNDDSPHVRLYWGREMVSQCPVSCLQGHSMLWLEVTAVWSGYQVYWSGAWVGGFSSVQIITFLYEYIPLRNIKNTQA